MTVVRDAGVPMVSSREYLVNLLRHELGFGGMLITDWKEMDNLWQWHMVSDHHHHHPHPHHHHYHRRHHHHHHHHHRNQNQNHHQNHTIIRPPPPPPPLPPHGPCGVQVSPDALSAAAVAVGDTSIDIFANPTNATHNNILDLVSALPIARDRDDNDDDAHGDKPTICCSPAYGTVNGRCLGANTKLFHR
jgi:ABC-type Zn2+ transport system substrate-binding protein/surface adhesin